MSVRTTLPPGFAELEPFVEQWAGATVDARMHARAGADMASIRRFYEVAVARGGEALEYCAQFPLDAMPDDAALLFRLMLGLAQASIAVEIHGQPRAPGTPWPNSITLQRGPSPFG